MLQNTRVGSRRLCCTPLNSQPSTSSRQVAARGRARRYRAAATASPHGGKDKWAQQFEEGRSELIFDERLEVTVQLGILLYQMDSSSEHDDIFKAIAARSVIQRERKHTKQDVDERLAQYKPGQRVQGVVTNIQPYGAFVRLPCGASGLLHISQTSEQRLNSVEKVLKPGDKITARVLRVNAERGRLALSTKPQPQVEQYKRGQLVEGVVTDVQRYGAFVRLPCGLVGLLHISQMTHERLTSVDQLFLPGDHVKVLVTSVDSARGRLTLNTKKLEETPGDMVRDPQLVWSKAEEMAEYSDGKTLKG